MSTSIAQRQVGDIASGGNVFDQLAQVARDPAIDAGKLSVIYELMKDYQEQQRKDEVDRARVAFYAALPDMQKELPVIRHDAFNPHTRSSYARLETIWEKCCQIWTRWGFAVVFDPKTLNGQISTAMRLSHRAGHVETFHAPEAAPDTTGIRGTTNKTGVQGNQSVISYQKRGLLGCLGIVTAGEDDDGAGGRAPSSVVQRSGRTMPPVATDEPIGGVRVVSGREEVGKAISEPLYPPATPAWLAPLEEKNQGKWLQNFDRLVDEALSEQAMLDIGAHHSVTTAIQRAPTLIVAHINEKLKDGMTRVMTKSGWEQDPNESDESENPGQER